MSWGRSAYGKTGKKEGRQEPELVRNPSYLCVLGFAAFKGLERLFNQTLEILERRGSVEVEILAKTET